VEFRTSGLNNARICVESSIDKHQESGAHKVIHRRWGRRNVRKNILDVEMEIREFYCQHAAALPMASLHGKIIRPRAPPFRRERRIYPHWSQLRGVAMVADDFSLLNLSASAPAATSTTQRIAHQLSLNRWNLAQIDLLHSPACEEVSYPKSSDPDCLLVCHRPQQWTLPNDLDSERTGSV
jgi:hypothetical protein